MELEEALELLALEGGEDERTTRRAYLRAVKRHPPERDPSGFQRVREAYDLVTSAPTELVASAPAPSAAPSSDSEAVDEGEDWDADAPEPAFEPHAQLDLEDAIFRDAASVPTDELLRMAADPDTTDLVFSILLAAPGRADVGPALLALLANTREERFRPGPVSGLVLQIIAAGDMGSADELWRARERWSPGARDASLGEAAHYQLLLELMHIRDEVEPWVLTEVARRILEQRWYTLEQFAAEYASSAPDSAKALRRRLKRDCPQLYAAFGKALRRPRNWAGWTTAVIIVVMLIVGGLQAIRANEVVRRADPGWEDSRAVRRLLVQPARSGKRPELAQRAELALEALDQRRCDLARPRVAELMAAKEDPEHVKLEQGFAALARYYRARCGKR